jgi:Spy/CpxP family protein refolding chaperone
MRKSIVMGLGGFGLALSLAGVATGQQPGSDGPRRERGEDHRGPGDKFGGPRGLLLKDITLSDAQKAQLKQLHESQRSAMQANHEAMKKQWDEARAARQRGDTAAARAIMERNRQAMEQARTQQLAAVRNILTPEQRIQFDKNVAELKQREAERGQRFGERGQRGGRGGFRGGKHGG